jgi:hypothetical protein
VPTLRKYRRRRYATKLSERRNEHLCRECRTFEA